MIRKFATVPACRVALLVILVTILAGATTVFAQETLAQQTLAQQTPAQQTPAQQPPAEPSAQPQAGQQPSSTQEATPEEINLGRKPKVKDYKNWTFNVGGGASLTNGTTAVFVRGGGPIAAAGVARNYSKYFGFRLDFQFDNLPLRNSALELAQAPGANSHVYSFTLDPIINVPVSKVWGGYILAGPAFYHRTGKLNSSTALPGLGCNPFFVWWGQCLTGSLPVRGEFLKANQNDLGENFGGGVTRKITENMEFYAEFRYLHGKHYNITTDLRPITIGVRW